VFIHGNFEFGSQPVAIQHVFEFSGRSRFLVFVRLPGGRKSTYEYLQTLWDFPQPWIPRDPTRDQVIVNRDLPQLPAGTQVALVRQMTLFDSHGNLVPAPITESVQIRVYRTITTGKEEHFEGSDVAARSGQDFYEIILSRPQLFVNQAGGLRATGRDEREFPIFQTQGEDPFEPLAKNLIPRRLETELIFLRCAICHSAGGINSLNSRRRLLKPNSLQHDSADGDPPRWWENDETVQWKQDRYDWGLLNGYWKLGEGSH
jgi:hypothetical protein